MKLYHVTRTQNDFSKFIIDTNLEGGRQLGDGIYLSEQPAYWEDRLFAKANDCKWLAVELTDGAKIFNFKTYTQSDSQAFIGWMHQNGWMSDGDATPKALELIERIGDHNDAVGCLKAEWLKGLGYDGLVDAPGEWGNNWVIWNLNLILSIVQVEKKYR